MSPNYCPHCRTVQSMNSFAGNFTITLCAQCKYDLGFPSAPDAPRDQSDAAREDIDAPLQPGRDVLAGTGKANTLEQTQPDPPPEPMRLRPAHTDPAAAAPPAPAP